MKFIVQMKDPDTLQDSIHDAVRASLAAQPDLDTEEREALLEVRREKVANVCRKWFEYGEYLRVEIDTESETCTVLAVK